jgi:hypothetical protein
MGKYNRFTAEFRVKVIKFAEQNGNSAVEREFFINETHICYVVSKKKSYAKRNAVLEHSEAPKAQNFLNLKINCINSLKKTRNNGNAV